MLNPWTMLNPYFFSDVKENSCGWKINLGNEYQTIWYTSPIHRRRWTLEHQPLIFTTKFVTSDKVHRRGGNQALVFVLNVFNLNLNFLIFKVCFFYYKKKKKKKKEYSFLNSFPFITVNLTTGLGFMPWV